ncbi:MAG: tetratricopeptide repeat protein, partial [Verrucomicrobiota bacterium]|nr:tetratricopeptide repeat protein [Verrucomicrobiota bacterium]
MSVLAMVLMGLAAGALLLRWYQRTEDRPGLLFSWVVTLATALFVVFVVGPVIARFDRTAAFLGVPLAALAGWVMAVAWAPRFVEWLGRKATDVIFGAETPPEPQPCYSVAEAHRKAGRYAAAIAEVKKQLEQFPTDFAGWMLLAEIHADNLHDMDGAMAAVEQFVAQPGHAPKNIAYALACVADWQLKYFRDLEMAKATFQRIVDMFPDSPEAHFARQRIAHLSYRSVGRGDTPPPPIHVPRTDGRPGLKTDSTEYGPAAPDSVAKAAELVEQLEKHPYDNQTREDLAVLYAESFDRVDLAAEQLEQLIAQEHVSDKQVARWLNLLADLQATRAGNLAAAREALQRIIDRFPGSPAAEQAHRRLATLNLELRGRQTRP